MTEVRIAGLVKTFGATRAVDGIALTVAEGELVSLLGPSGCGKTTTLKIIAGFEDADAGSIAFDGRDMAHVPAEKRDIGMVFQNYALFPHMTVAGNLAFGLEVRRVPKPEMARRIAAVLDMVQLGTHADRYPRQLSGGQQQRVALARALVIEPKILLLDEPLANLDAKLREEMRVFIRDLQKRVGITTIYVTHDQAEAMTMSDRVVVMFGGRIAQAGRPPEIYERPASVEVARFVGQANLIAATVAERRDGRCRLDSEIGPLEVAADAVPAAGGLTVLLRPEAIGLTAPGPAPGRPGRVEASYYSGSLIDYRVRLDGGASLHVQTMPTVRFQAGDAVDVVIAADRCWPLPA